MEKKIESLIWVLFRQYGCDKSFKAVLQVDRILTRCMNELASHPTLEKELDTGKTLHYFVMQIILEDASMEKVERIG